MQLFKVSVARTKNPKWYDYAMDYLVWAKDLDAATQAVYDQRKLTGLTVGKTRITGRVYNARKPIIRQML